MTIFGVLGDSFFKTPHFLQRQEIFPIVFIRAFSPLGFRGLMCGFPQMVPIIDPIFHSDHVIIDVGTITSTQANFNTF